MRDRYIDDTPWIHKRYPFNVLFGPKARTPQEVSPELFINTAVPQGFNFAGEYVPPQAVLPAQLPAALPVQPEAVAPTPYQVPTAGTAMLYGAGLGGLTGAGLGLLINGDAAGAIGGGLLGAGVGGAAAPFLSPYLVAKLNELYGLNGG